MSLGPSGWPIAAVEAAPTVAGGEDSAEAGAGEALAASGVDRNVLRVEDDAVDAGVAGQPPDGVGRQEAAVLGDAAHAGGG
jgi:hypothetical protein